MLKKAIHQIPSNLIYEKIVSSEDDINELSQINNGDFIDEFVFSDVFTFTNEILTFDVNFDGLQDIFASYTELPFKPTMLNLRNTLHLKKVIL